MTRLVLGGVLIVAWVAAGHTQAAPAFEAVSIRPAAGRAIDFRFFPDRFVATVVTLPQLIEQAYSLEARELEGGPEWVRVDRWDVTATAGARTDRSQMQQMLQAMLAERFQLRIAREMREGTVYALTARQPRGLQSPAHPDERSLITLERLDGNGFLSYRYDGHNATMAQLAESLAAQLQAPVADETKLFGHYDFHVPYAYDRAFGGLEPDPNVPTIYTALERELGLKLVAVKGDIPMWVITNVARPTPN